MVIPPVRLLHILLRWPPWRCPTYRRRSYVDERRLERRCRWPLEVSFSPILQNQAISIYCERYIFYYSDPFILERYNFYYSDLFIRSLCVRQNFYYFPSPNTPLSHTWSEKKTNFLQNIHIVLRIWSYHDIICNA